MNATIETVGFRTGDRVVRRGGMGVCLGTVVKVAEAYSVPWRKCRDQVTVLVQWDNKKTPRSIRAASIELATADELAVARAALRAVREARSAACRERLARTPFEVRVEVRVEVAERGVVSVSVASGGRFATWEEAEDQFQWHPIGPVRSFPTQVRSRVWVEVVG